MKENTKNILDYKQSGELYYKRAMRYIDNGDNWRGAKVLYHALSIEPDNRQYRLDLAQALSGMDYYELSNKEILKLMNDPSDIDNSCYYGLGFNFYGMNKFEKAVPLLNKYLSEEPFGVYSEDAFEIVEIIYDMLEDIDDQEETLYDVIFSDMKSNVRNIKSSLLSKDANKWADEHNASALNAYIKKDYQGALDICKKILNKIPNEINALCTQSLTYERLDNQAQARESILAVLEHISNDEVSLHKAMFILCELKMHKKIKGVLIKLLTYRPENPLYTHYLAIAYYNLKEYNKACDILKQRLEMLQGDIVTSWYYGECIKRINSSYEHKELKYMMDLPSHAVTQRLAYIDKIIKLEEKPDERLWEIQEFRDTVIWGLNIEDKQTRRALLYLIYACAGDQRELLFRTFLIERQESEELKKDVLSYLKRIEAKEPYIIMNDNSLAEVSVSVISVQGDKLPKVYVEVLEKALKYCIEDKQLTETLLEIWGKYVGLVSVKLPRIRNSKLWSVALFASCKYILEQDVDVKDLAKEYNLSKSSLYITMDKIINVLED